MAGFTLATYLAIGGLALAAGSTVYSTVQQRKAASAQREQQALATRRSRRQSIREALIRRAETTAIANAYGSADSTGYYGSVGSLGSQLGSGLGYSTQMSGLSSVISSATQRAGYGQAGASLGGAIFNFGLNAGADFKFSGLAGSDPLHSYVSNTPNAYGFAGA